MNSFLKSITSLTAIASGAAAAMIVLGIVSIIGGSYDHQVVHDQLAPQKIFFEKPSEYKDLTAYAGQQVLTGQQAKLYAEDQIGPDLNEVAHGQTYAQVSEQWIAGGMKNATLASERTTLFTGETLKGLLLNAWGWAQIGSIAILAGIILIIVGVILLILPLLNWWMNLRGAESDTRVREAGPAGGAAPSGA